MDEQLEMALKGSSFKHLMESRFTRIKTDYDLKKVDIEVLYFLSNCKEKNTPTDIYKKLGLNRGHVSQAIDSLCRRELIIAVPDQKDRRYMHYMVSDKAGEIIEQIAEIKQELDRQIFKGITEEEILAYKKTTEKIFKNMQQLL